MISSLARGRVRFITRSFAPMLFGAIAGACRAPTDGATGAGPEPPRVTGLEVDAREVPHFFTAFSHAGWSFSSPIQTQPYDTPRCRENPDALCLTAYVFRQQWSAVRDWQTVGAWARHADHRGHLYVVGDAVHDGDYADNPALFAKDYCTFVKNVRAVDGSAQFSPGLVEDWATDEWLNAFARALLSVYRGGSCSFNPVSEWEFNLHGRWSEGLAGAQAYVDRRAAWAASQRAPLAAPMVLSGWTLGSTGDDVADDDPAYVARLREFKAWLFAHDNVILARYHDYEPWPEGNPNPHPLTKAGGLTATGRAYAEVTGRIAGARVVHPSATCTWVAEITGGSAPYAFAWSLNGASASASSAISVKSESGFTLEMIVTDASGGRSRAKIEVKVNLDAPPCL
jgi:hypothetical protein